MHLQRSTEEFRATEYCKWFSIHWRNSAFPLTRVTSLNLPTMEQWWSGVTVDSAYKRNDFQPMLIHTALQPVESPNNHWPRCLVKCFCCSCFLACCTLELRLRSSTVNVHTRCTLLAWKQPNTSATQIFWQLLCRSLLQLWRLPGTFTCSPWLWIVLQI